MGGCRESAVIAQLRHDIMQAATDKASQQARLEEKASAVQQLTARVNEIEDAAESQSKVRHALCPCSRISPSPWCNLGALLLPGRDT